MNAKIKSKEQFTLVLGDGKSDALPGHKKKQQRVKQDAWFYLGFVGQIGYSIALPIAGGALLGEYLDRLRSSYPRATLFLLFVGFILSFLGFVKTIQDLINKTKS